MKIRRCKICSGKGFTYSTVSKIKGEWLVEEGCKVLCKKCYGKGIVK